MDNNELQFYIPGSEIEEEHHHHHNHNHDHNHSSSQEPKTDKVSDKELNRSIVISIVSILLCMTCLFGLTWAWFSTSVVSKSNKITSATFNLGITVKDKNGEAVTEKDEQGYYLLDISETYTVELAKKGTAKTGFCILSVVVDESGSATPYFTDSIPKIDENTQEQTDPFVFTVKNVLKIKFSPMWGKCTEEQAASAIKYGNSLDPSANAQKTAEKKQTEQQKSSQTAKTESEVPSSVPEKTESQPTGTETASEVSSQTSGTEQNTGSAAESDS